MDSHSIVGVSEKFNDYLNDSFCGGFKVFTWRSVNKYKDNVCFGEKKKTKIVERR